MYLNYWTHIAENFIPNKDKKPQVNHINKIRDDNRVENLEWVTAIENNIHAKNLSLVPNQLWKYLVAYVNCIG